MPISRRHTIDAFTATLVDIARPIPIQLLEHYVLLLVLFLIARVNVLVRGVPTIAFFVGGEEILDHVRNEDSVELVPRPLTCIVARVRIAPSLEEIPATVSNSATCSSGLKSMGPANGETSARVSSTATSQTTRKSLGLKNSR